MSLSLYKKQPKVYDLFIPFHIAMKLNILAQNTQLDEITHIENAVMDLVALRALKTPKIKNRCKLIWEGSKGMSVNYEIEWMHSLPLRLLTDFISTMPIKLSQAIILAIDLYTIRHND